jgi:hypothetical protein
MSRMSPFAIPAYCYLLVVLTCHPHPVPNMCLFRRRWVTIGRRLLRQSSSTSMNH